MILIGSFNLQIFANGFTVFHVRLAFVWKNTENLVFKTPDFDMTA